MFHLFCQERESALEVEISSLRKQIGDQKSQMMDHQKLVMALQVLLILI